MRDFSRGSTCTGGGRVQNETMACLRSRCHSMTRKGLDTKQPISVTIGRWSLPYDSRSMASAISIPRYIVHAALEIILANPCCGVRHNIPSGNVVNAGKSSRVFRTRAYQCSLSMFRLGSLECPQREETPPRSIGSRPPCMVCTHMEQRESERRVSKLSTFTLSSSTCARIPR